MRFFCATRFLKATSLLFTAMNLLIAAAKPVSADDTKPAVDVAKLVAQLGSDSYAARQQAMADLIKANDVAFEAVQAATQSTDTEVSYRAQRILSMIAKQDHKRRIDAFLKREELRQPLAFWSDALSVMGDTDASRRLFASMHETDGELLEMAVNEPKNLDAAVRERSAQIMQRSNGQGGDTPPLGQVAVLALVAGSPSLDLSSTTEQVVLNMLLHNTMRTAMSDEKNREPCRALIVRMIQNVGTEASYQALRIAMDYELSEGLTVARRLISEEGAPHTHFQQMAIMTIYKLGNTDDLPRLEKMLDDVRVIGRAQQDKTIHELQLRDAALCAAVKLSGQKLEDYFTINDQQASANLQQMFFNPRSIGFIDTAKREEAIARYRKTREQQAPKK